MTRPAMSEPVTVFRTFSPAEFLETASWARLARILKGNGGCYGLYGPRGSGKSWLMMKAIASANAQGGLGLWFPSPSEYDAATFLSALSDNLASTAERRFSERFSLVPVLSRARWAILTLAFAPLVWLLLIYLTSSADDNRSFYFKDFVSFFMWPAIVLMATFLLVAFFGQYIIEKSPRGRLLRDAQLLRERIRYSVNLKHASEAALSGGKSLTGTLKRSLERSLAERPVTTTSLVFDFRDLAASIALFLQRPVVIGIDELDKMENPLAVRTLLRDIKGIFEVAGVHFLVSVSEEAATALQLGTLHAGGRNEFNSSFYTVIELPPLVPKGAVELLASRGYEVGAEIAAALCLLAAGNQRELIRLADIVLGEGADMGQLSVEQTIVRLMKDEAMALLREIIKTPLGDPPRSVSEDAKSGAWNVMDASAFNSVKEFSTLAKSAIHRQWSPEWADERWEPAAEPWRRLLVRLFVSASVLRESKAGSDAKPVSLLTDTSAVEDLGDVLIMAAYDSGVADLMLRSRFGKGLDEAYRTTEALRLPAP